MNSINVDKIVEYWKNNSIDDLESVEQFLSTTSKHLQAMFFLHLSIEKILKALSVKTNNQHAPLTHNLLYLSEKCSIQLSDDQKKLLSEINEFNLECRYPNDKTKLQNKLTKEISLQYLYRAKEFHLWILTHLE